MSDQTPGGREHPGVWRHSALRKELGNSYAPRTYIPGEDLGKWHTSPSSPHEWQLILQGQRFVRLHVLSAWPGYREAELFLSGDLRVNE